MLKLKCPLGNSWYAKFGDEAIYIDRPQDIVALALAKFFRDVPCELKISRSRMFATSAYLELRTKC